MRILIISNMYPSKQKPYSGLFVLNQVNELIAKYPSDTLDFLYLKRSFTNKVGSALKYLIFVLRLFPFMFKTKYNVIHVHYYFPTIYLALLYKLIRNRKVTIIVTFHGGDFYSKNIKSKVYQMPFKYITHIIAVSKELGIKIKEQTKIPITILSAGINPLFCKKTEVMSVEKFDLIYVGSFYEVKGFDLFCRSLNLVERALNICIIGSGHLESEIININGRHNITLKKNLKQIDISPLIHQSKFLINTSRNESFGLSMTEAMACSTPVISTITDGSNEQIINGINGVLIPSKTKESIAMTIEESLEISSIEYEKMKMEASKHGHKNSLPIIVNELHSLYSSLNE